ncbi:hypothetical protein D3C75_991800 [compost metagenome]
MEGEQTRHKLLTIIMHQQLLGQTGLPKAVAQLDCIFERKILIRRMILIDLDEYRNEAFAYAAAEFFNLPGCRM